MINKISSPYRIPASWEACDAVVLVWPGQECEDELLEFYEALASVLPDYADLFILVALNQELVVKEHVESLSLPMEYIFFHQVNLSDVNIAKWGPVIVQTETGLSILCSDKMPSEFLQSLAKLFPCADSQSIDFLFTQRAIESDGVDQLIVNKNLLLEQNPGININEAISFLKESSGAKDLIVIDQPDSIQHLPVRLAPNNCILMTVCDDPESPHFAAFNKMQREIEHELQRLVTDYQLRYLPWLGVLTDEQGREYFADYSQYLVINGVILVPIFNLPSDEDAMELISQTFSGFEILGFPSAVLARLGSGLANISLNMPEGVLEPLYE